MPFTLQNVVPWGRSMDEYIAIFELSAADLDGRVLACADGPASFNAQMHAQGRRVVSVDPIYRFTPQEIRKRVDQTYAVIMQQLDDNHKDYLWDRFASPQALGRHRMSVMETFLTDLPAGLAQRRYITCEMPTLPFEDQAFDLALCSHFLFLYSEQLSATFHYQAIDEMLRVAKEVRVFPLLTLARQRSPHLGAICARLHESNHKFEIRTVDYEFQRGGNEMLRIW